MLHQLAAPGTGDGEMRAASEAGLSGLRNKPSMFTTPKLTAEPGVGLSGCEALLGAGEAKAEASLAVAAGLWGTARVQEGCLPLMLVSTVLVAAELAEPLDKNLPVPLTVLLLLMLASFPWERGDRSWDGEHADSLCAVPGIVKGAGEDKRESESESSRASESGVRSDSGKGALAWDVLVHIAG